MTSTTTRRAVIAGATLATAAAATAAVPAIAGTDPAVLAARRYREAEAAYNAAIDALGQRQREVSAEVPQPFPPDSPRFLDRGEAERLLVQYFEQRGAVAARSGIDELDAERERTSDIEAERFAEVAATEATTIEGLAAKLRVLAEWLDRTDADVLMAGVLADAERLAKGGAA